MLGLTGSSTPLGNSAIALGLLSGWQKCGDVGNDVTEGRTTTKTATNRMRAAPQHDGYWVSGGMYGPTAGERVRVVTPTRGQSGSRSDPCYGH